MCKINLTTIRGKTMKDKKLEDHLLLIHAVARHLNKWEEELKVLETEDWKLTSKEKAKKHIKFDKKRLEVLLSELGKM